MVRPEAPRSTRIITPIGEVELYGPVESRKLKGEHWEIRKDSETPCEVYPEEDLLDIGQVWEGAETIYVWQPAHFGDCGGRFSMEEIISFLRALYPEKNVVASGGREETAWRLYANLSDLHEHQRGEGQGEEDQKEIVEDIYEHTEDRLIQLHWAANQVTFHPAGAEKAREILTEHGYREEEVKFLERLILGDNWGMPFGRFHAHVDEDLRYEDAVELIETWDAIVREV